MEFSSLQLRVGALSPRETPKAWIAAGFIADRRQRLGYVLCEPKQLLIQVSSRLPSLITK